MGETQGLGFRADGAVGETQGNLLDDLPDTFGQLSSLTSLLASSNRFPYLPSQVGACSAIQKLWMRDCQVTPPPSRV